MIEPGSQPQEGNSVDKEPEKPSVPQWLRTTFVAAVGIAFFIHLGYDALDDNYSEFNTSLLLIGFVGVALGYDVIGRK